MNAFTQIAVVLACCFGAYLLLLAVVVLRTGSTDGLVAVAAAVHSFIGAIVALIKRWPVEPIVATRQGSGRADDGQSTTTGDR
ncbi:hypothetical protein [Mycolicibacterium sediminis]|uniref:Uncharacterized protein n=1 Tax=Mycolicibacterium sediminis TaxID=1286180 RepID=A0A7I7QQT0_9MYCO|nr:hypothetical protein [Mycolicibacterium sediminis]BBY28749.1 hypothetical protein MSEDJ_28450 [Mycolicibacterium sediminis]